MLIIALLLILIIGMAFTLLGTPDVYSGKAPVVAHRVLSRGSPQDFGSCCSRGEDFQISCVAV